jgi:GT2 family glycosyltransferase/SAM-dependent methyltransferase
MDIEYSDGQEIEGRILRLIREATDRSAAHAIASEHYGQAWPIRYHLCPERSNLLRPFDFTGLDVLELGAGMGAVSRFLAEKARTLYVVEGTQPRFEVLSERLADLSNWDGQVGNFQTFQSDRKFDVVCLVGVLEYSELFLKDTGESPHLWLLKRCRAFLNPGGVLLVAIENSVGLKYWSGAAEDHRATLFDGVVGYPDSATPRTFSRKELCALLENAGFGHTDTYYPFPDYKVPTTVVAEALFEKAPQLAAELSTVEPYRDYLGHPLIKYFSDTLAAENLSRAGLLADFSNSFLFAASEQDSPIRRQLMGRTLGNGELAWHYGQGRRDATQTVFYADRVTQKVFVQKSGLYSAQSPKTYPASGLGTLRWTALQPEEVLQGRSVRAILARHAYFQEWNAFGTLLEGFLRWSVKRWATDKPAQLAGLALDGIFVNARLPEAIAYMPGQPVPAFVLFDQEWSLDEPIPASWFIARNVFNLVREESLLNSSAPFVSLKDLYNRLCVALGVRPDLSADLLREARLQAATSRGSQQHHLTQLEGLFDRRFGSSVLPRIPAVESVLRLPRRKWTARRVAGVVKRRLIARLDRTPKIKKLVQAVVRRTRSSVRAVRKARYFLQPRSPKLTPSDRPGEFTALFTCFPRGFICISVEGRVIPRSLTFGMRVEGLFTQQTIPIDTKVIVVKVNAEIESLALEVAGYTVAPRIWIRKLSKFEAALRCVPARGARLLLDRKKLRAQISLPVVDAYGAWVQRYDTLTASDRTQIETAVAVLERPPLISVLMPVYNTDPRWLRAALDSVTAQIYPHWELCIADDASTTPDVRAILERYAARDKRIRVIYRRRNGHISEASNSALALAQGEFSALLDHDDVLAPHALAMVAVSLAANPEADLIYSDEDKIDAAGRRFDPHFKTDWNPELLRGKNFISHLGVYRTALLKQIGGFRTGMEGSQDYDLALRFVEKTQPERIRHLPQILYHWRAIPGSVALAEDEKSYAHDRAREAIRQAFKRQGVEARVEQGFGFMHRVRLPLADSPPPVTVIIPTRDRRDLLEAIAEGVRFATDYPHIELLIVDNQTTDPQTLDYFRVLLQDPRVRILRYDAPFNYAAMMNLAAREAKHPILALLNNDLRLLSRDWLTEMVTLALQPGVGCVGAKLLYPNRTVQHAGVYLGIGGVADHLYKHVSADSAVAQGALQCTTAVSAVTAACLVVRKETFEKAGGFNETDLGVAYNDVDFSLKVRALGLRNVWTPFAQLIHLESANRGSDAVGASRARLEREALWMKRHWGAALENDPYLSPNISLKNPDGVLAFPPRRPPFYRGVCPLKAAAEMKKPSLLRETAPSVS